MTAPAVFALVILAFMVIIRLSYPLTAMASPGDLWVFGADAPVTDDPAQQQAPAVSGDTAVWTDCRPEGRSCSIYLRRLDDDGPESELIPGSRGQGSPDIDGRLVVWEQLVHPDTGGIGYQIYYAAVDGPAARPLSPVATHQMHPAVSGSRVVWEDERAGSKETDIYMYDLDTGVERPVCTASSRQRYPDIEGEWTIWVDNRDGRYLYGRPTRNDIYAGNLETGEERRLTFDEGEVVQGNPRLGRAPDGAYRAVYEGQGIWLYDFRSGTTSRLAAEGTQPDIDGDIVVWRAADGLGIMMHDLSTGESQMVPAAAVGVFNPSVAGSRIVWGDERAGNRDIYQATLRVRAQELAERHRPVLKMAAGERFQPAPVEQMLAAPDSFLRKRNDPAFQPLPNPAPDVLASQAGIDDLYLDLAGDATAAGGGDPSVAIDDSYVYDNYVKPYKDHRDRYPATVYARIVDGGQDDGGGTAIQYWLNYYANDHPELFHEGDWELVQVELGPRLEPYKADYSHHGGGSWRYWSQVEKSRRFPEQPVVYVAAGSHANYFNGDGRQYIKWPIAWDVARGDGDTVYPAVTVVPETGQAEGSAFGWLDYAGQWGEYTGAKVGVGIGGAGGLRDGPDNPPLQGYWRDPFNWPSITCDGCRDGSGEGTDLELTGSLTAEIHLYDSQGRHTGSNGAGGMDLQIPGSEYLAYPELDRASIIVRGGDVNDGYRAVVAGVSTGPLALTLTAPDHRSGTVDTVSFSAIAADPLMGAEMSIDAGKDYILAVEAGDGGGVTSLTPDAVTTRDVDFTPPAAVSDLAVTAVAAGSVTLTFTAPGDDGNQGTAARYDLRYGTGAITGGNWKDAVPAPALPAPQAAGSAQSVTISGLDAGTEYYFAVRALDEMSLYGPLSNPAVTTTRAPQLTWSAEQIYWASLADYQDRKLSVEYRMANTGNDDALAVTVAASYCNNDLVDLVTETPLVVGDIQPSASRTLTLRYHVPVAVMRFNTLTYAFCLDGAGGTRWYPEELT